MRILSRLRARVAAYPFIAALMFCVFVVAAAVFFVPERKSTPPSALKTATAADVAAALYQSGRYKAAADSLRAAYKIDRDPRKKIELMYALYGAGDYKSVLALWLTNDAGAGGAKERNAISDGSGDVVAGEAMVKLAQYERALAIAKARLEIAPYDRSAAFLAARAASGLGRFQASRTYLGQVLRSAPDSAAASRKDALSGEAWMFRMRRAVEDGEFDVARSALRRAGEAGVSASRRDGAAIEIMIREGRLDDGRRALASRKSRELTRPAAAARPGQAPPVDVYGLYLDALLSYVAGGAPDRAFNTLSPWLKHEIRGPLQMAYVNWRAGDVAQAADQFETYAEAAPQDWIALDALAAFQILRRTRQDERAAMKAIDQLTAANPAAGSFRRFQLAILQEDFEEAYATALTGDMAPKRLSADVLFGAAADQNDLLGAYRSLVMLSSQHEEGAASAPTEANPAIVNNANQGLALLHGVLAARRLMASGDRETAAAHLDRQLVAAPSFEPAILLRTLIDLEAGRLGDAVNRVEGGLSKTEVEAQDRHRSMRLLLARTLRAIAKDAAAAKALAPIADQLLEAEDTALFYAATLEAAGDGEALKLFAQRAQTVRAEPALAAMLFERAGDPGRAARLYREALFEAPLNGEHARRYAAAMEQAGRGTDAVALLEVLVRKNPEASGARAEIARLKGAVVGQPAVPASEPRAAVAIAMPAPAGPEDRLRVFDTAESGAIAFHVGQRFAEGSAERLAKVRIACFWGIEEACKEVAKTGS